MQPLGGCYAKLGGATFRGDRMDRACDADTVWFAVPGALSFNRKRCPEGRNPVSLLPNRS